MNLKKKEFTPEQYVTEMEYEYAGLINTLSYLSQEAKTAKLELVSLHLNIAIDELKEYRPPKNSRK